MAAAFTYLDPVCDVGDCCVHRVAGIRHTISAQGFEFTAYMFQSSECMDTSLASSPLVSRL